MESIPYVIPSLVAVILGLGGGYAAARLFDKSRIQSAKTDAEEIVKTATKEAETIKKEALLQAKDKLFQARTDLENEIKERRSECQCVRVGFSRRKKTLSARRLSWKAKKLL